jgi:hypothetical protein
MMNQHDGLALPRPALDTNAEVRRLIQSGGGTELSEEASTQRLAEIERDAAVLRAIRDDSEIRAKSERLAKAIIAAIERKPETPEE